MSSRKTKFLILIALLALSIGVANATISSEDRTNSHDMNALFLWAADPSDMTFDVGASDLSDLAVWSFYNSPYGAIDNSAWVLHAPDLNTGGGVVSAGSSTVTIGFDYRVDSIFGSTFQYQYALVLWNGASATIQASGTRRVVRGFLNFGINFWPALNATQIAQIDSYLSTTPAPAAVPIPNAAALMLSAVAFLGFSRRALPATT
jgi:hypothetical protein